MQSSASTGALASLADVLESTGGGAGGGLKEFKRSYSTRSSPCLASSAAYNLRQYSIDRRRLAPPLDPRIPNLPLETIDYLGGNGNWRKKKAKVEWARREVEERERRRQQRILEEARREREKAIEARRLEAERKRKQAEAEELERREQERLEKERLRREEEERERLRREQEKADWLARQPKTCHVCGGSGTCLKCGGKGYAVVCFLAPMVKEKPLTSHGRGRVQIGCPDCGGYAEEIPQDTGRHKGTGNCMACNGAGKIAPKLPPSVPVRRGGLGASPPAAGGAASPVSPSSPAPAVAVIA